MSDTFGGGTGVPEPQHKAEFGPQSGSRPSEDGLREEAERDAWVALLNLAQLRERCEGDLEAECLPVPRKGRTRCFEPEVQSLAAIVLALLDAIELVDTPYPLAVFPERTDEQRDAIFAAMRTVDPYATEWFYAHVARERGRVARESLAASPVPEEQP